MLDSKARQPLIGRIGPRRPPVEPARFGKRVPSRESQAALRAREIPARETVSAHPAREGRPWAASGPAQGPHPGHPHSQERGRRRRRCGRRERGPGAAGSSGRLATDRALCKPARRAAARPDDAFCTLGRGLCARPQRGRAPRLASRCRSAARALPE